MSVKYTDVFAVHRGISLSTPEDVQFTGGYHGYTGGYPEYTGDTMMSARDIMSTQWDVQSTGVSKPIQ